MFGHFGIYLWRKSASNSPKVTNFVAVNIRLLLIILSLSCCAPVLRAATPFIPELNAVVRDYVKTEPVMLPPLDEGKLNELDDDIAYPPGVMPYTRHVVIDKGRRRLSLVNPHGVVLEKFAVCSSVNRGQKRKKDDCKTPEGTFKIIGIYNSTDWTYKDTGQKAYGPYFIHLYTAPFFGIGIHGTNAPYSVPGRSSHGCVRMVNDNIRLLRAMVNKDTRVTILSDTIQDILDADGRRESVEKGALPPLNPR